MKKLVNKVWFLICALILAACNPFSSNSDGQSVWFAEDNSMIIEVVGNKSIVTYLEEERHDPNVLKEDRHTPYVYSNNFANDGSLQVLDDGNVLFSSIGTFSHSEQELDFAFGKRLLKLTKAPNVSLSDIKDKWLEVFEKDEDFAIADIKENYYHFNPYNVDHKSKEYEYQEDKDIPFELVDGYKFIELISEESKKYIIYIKHFEAEKEIEFVDIYGYAWTAYWYPEKTQLVPADYKQVDRLKY